MKRHFKLITLLIIVVSFTIVRCKFNYSEPTEKLNATGDTSALLISKKALRLIRENKVDSLKGLFNKRIVRMIEQDQLDWVMKNGKIVLDEYEYPNNTSILKSTTTKYTVVGKKEIIETLRFPFQHKFHKDSTMSFEITVINGEIHRLSLYDY